METYHKGKKQIMIIIGLMIAISFLTIILTILVGDKDFKTQIGNLILTATLCYFLYKGKRWARIVTIVLLGLGTILGVFIAFQLKLPFNLIITPILQYFILTEIIAYGYCFITLFTSRHIKEFIRQKNQ